VLARVGEGTCRFPRWLPPPAAGVARLVPATAGRGRRLLARRGLAGDADAADPLVTESLALAGLAGAAVQGRLALGPRAGSRVERLRHAPHAPRVQTTPPLHGRCARRH